MRKICSFAMGVVLALLGSVVYAHAQKATEQFIPIAESPGVSNKLTVIGEIDQYDAEAKTVTIATPAGKQTFNLTEKTKIYLDRTKLRLRNLEGKFGDLRKGRRAEVKFKDQEGKTNTDWVKIEMTEPGPGNN